MDVSRYRDNYKGFCENFIYLISIYMREMAKSQDAHASIVRILTFLLSLSEEH